MERKLITDEWLDTLLDRDKGLCFTTPGSDKRCYEWEVVFHIVIRSNDDDTYTLEIRYAGDSFERGSWDYEKLRKVKYQDEVELIYNFLNE